MLFILASYDSRGGQNSWRERKIIPPSYPQGYDKSMTDGGMYEKKAACRDGLSLKDFASYDYIAPEIILFLEMNEFEDKAEVARQKILANHFIGEDIDIHAFQQMPESILPFAIEWIGSDEDGFTLLNTIVRGFPSLLDINSMIHVQG